MKLNTSAILLGAALVGAAAPAAAVDVGLMAYYPFNGNANDASGNKNHGTLQGGVSLTADRKGKAKSAYLFNGVDGYITVPDSPSLNPVDQVTVAFWMRVDGFTNSWSPIIYKGQSSNCSAGREYSTWIGNTPLIYVGSGGDFGCEHALAGNSFSALGKWNFVAVVIDRQTSHKMRLYVNGVLQKEIADNYSSFNISRSNLMIGWSPERIGSYSPFKGALDDIRLYNRALGAAEIQQMYRIDAPVSGSASGFSTVNVVCANKTTGKSVTFASTNTTASTWNCEQKGLAVRPGDQVSVTLSGKAHQ